MLIRPAHYLAAAKIHGFWRRLSIRLFGEQQKQRLVKDLLSQRRPDRQRLYWVSPKSSCHDALRLMLGENITAVLVMADNGANGKPLGIVTQTDLLQKIALPDLPAKATLVTAIMTPISRCAYAFPENDLESCLQILALAGAHHLPILSDFPPEGRVLAVVSLPELVGLTRTVRDARSKAALERGVRLPGTAGGAAAVEPPATASVVLDGPAAASTSSGATSTRSASMFMMGA
jgi:CBS domain-containing protein